VRLTDKDAGAHNEATIGACPSTARHDISGKFMK
jgi:hypothetical protein